MTISSSERATAADLPSLAAAIAGSPIVVPFVGPATELVFADWQSVRRSENVDALILAWIASHVRGVPYRRRAH